MAGFTFCLTILLSSFLLFMVQPLIGRMLLPSLGGTPAVWNTCVVFFQGVLLAGYTYAHYVSSRLRPSNQVKLHFILLGLICFLIPIRMFVWSEVPTHSDPTIWLLIQLALMIGLPFFVISANAPLLQRWYGLIIQSRNTEDSSKQKNKDPYFLYAFSNIGSLTALLAYPFLIEPQLGVSQQSIGWSLGLTLLVVGFLACGWLIFSIRKTESACNVASEIKTNLIRKPEKLWKQRLHWVALAAVPSSLMLGVTSHLSTDVGSVPMLWVIPLAIYLTTFILAFSRKQIISHQRLVQISPILILLMAVVLLVDLGTNPWTIVPVHLITFFVIAMVCHGEMNRLRPSVERLTEFYLLMSIGGFVGGVFNALVAPQLFQEVWEYPLALIAACCLRPQLGTTKVGFSWKDLAWPVGIGLYGFASLKMASWLGCEGKLATAAILFLVPAIVCYGFVERPIRFALCVAVIIFSCQWAMVDQNVIMTQRGFFGVNKVSLDRQAGFRMLINGRTMHGIQFLDSKRELEPLSYYHRTGPMGDVFDSQSVSRAKQVAIVGLGTGSVASYSKPDQTFDFFEIDPVVCEIASNPQYFSYLQNAKGRCNLIVGDARVQLKRTANEKKYDLLVIDAFSSDSIPIHLLTTEAFQLFRQRLHNDGVLAVHITNKHIDLKPLLVGVAEMQKWNLHIKDDQLQGDHKANDGKLSSTWVVFTFGDPDSETIRSLKNRSWSKLDGTTLAPWTDERSNLLDVLKWSW